MKELSDEGIPKIRNIHSQNKSVFVKRIIEGYQSLPKCKEFKTFSTAERL